MLVRWGITTWSNRLTLSLIYASKVQRLGFVLYWQIWNEHVKSWALPARCKLISEQVDINCILIDSLFTSRKLRHSQYVYNVMKPPGMDHSFLVQASLKQFDINCIQFKLIVYSLHGNSALRGEWRFPEVNWIYARLVEITHCLVLENENEIGPILAWFHTFSRKQELLPVHAKKTSLYIRVGYNLHIPWGGVGVKFARL